MSIRISKRHIYRLFLWMIILCGAVNGVAQSRKSNEYFQNGIDAYHKADYLTAIEWFAKTKELDERELHPYSPRLRYSDDWIAFCYYKAGDIDKAKEFSQYIYFR